MPRITAALAALFFLLPLPARAQDSTLADLLSDAREEAGLIGMGAAVMVEGEIVALAVDGERIKGKGGMLSRDDAWHLGSITKSMTGTLIATMVEDGTLSFETTIGDIYGDAADESWRGVTLSQLLTHTSGAPGNFSLIDMLSDNPETRTGISRQRQAKVEKMISAPLPGKSGEFLYSNVGFTIAGAMAEKAADGTPWEELLSERVFTPLGIEISFGPPTGEAAPWGHAKGIFGKSPRNPAARADNPAFIGPAGTAALPLADLLRYGQAHLSQDPALLSRASYDLLHTPPSRNEETGFGYAYGWVSDPSGGGYGAGPIIWHNGSNTYWYALLILVPDERAVIALVTNDGDLENAEPAFQKLAARIAQDFDLTP
ncbi:serine hydrolase domain-containing protein [Parvularcula marina]|nr:serine hydrolase domain-containing protein [Parvularcula marina]